MPIATRTAARDIILTHFKTLWDAAAPTTTGVVVYYDDVAGVELPDTFVKVFVRHTLAGQRTLAEAGSRRFERLGLVIVQIFTPAAEGQVDSDLLTQVVNDIFEGKKTTGSEVWFRNTQAVEVGRDRAWFQVNVTAEFQYDAIK